MGCCTAGGRNIENQILTSQNGFPAPFTSIVSLVNKTLVGENVLGLGAKETR